MFGFRSCWEIDLRVDIISTRRLKPRLHKRSPPPRTKKNYLQPTEVGFACVDAVSTAVFSFQGLQTPTKKPGFYRISRLKSSIFGKNPVSGPPPPSKETGFLPESVGCREVFWKKPGFWHTAIDFLGNRAMAYAPLRYDF